MKTYKAGDKVRFLNDVGGGTVVRIIDSRMALVAIEDGFEIPVLQSELILMEETRTPSHREAAQDVLQKSLQEKEALEQLEREEARKTGLRRFAKNPEAEGFYLAFVPHDQQWILTGLLDVVLANHSPYEMLYTVTLAENDHFTNIDYGQLAPYSKLVIETISREDLNAWTKGLVQGLLIVENSKDIFLPLHASFDIKANRFFKEGSYISAAILGEKAIMVLLENLQSLRSNSVNINKDFTPSVSETVKQPVKKHALIEKHRKAVGEAIVDLHIGELLDNIAGLSSHDMFKIQMDYFHKTLNSAIMEEYDKVTYIHGVGNGVLKNAIVKALDDFEGLNNRMASMSKFGVGAIEVLIREK